MSQPLPCFKSKTYFIKAHFSFRKCNHSITKSVISSQPLLGLQLKNTHMQLLPLQIIFFFFFMNWACHLLSHSVIRSHFSIVIFPVIAGLFLGLWIFLWRGVSHQLFRFMRALSSNRELRGKSPSQMLLFRFTRALFF